MTGSMTSTPIWQELCKHAEEIKAGSLADIVLADPKRLQDCEVGLEGLRLNYALNHVTPKTVLLLMKLAEEQKLPEWRTRMLNGDKINVTEKRAVLHTALRQKTGPVYVDGKDVMPEIVATQKRIAEFVASVRNGQWTGSTGKPIQHIVNIGIGGSDLGPRLATHALKPYASKLEVDFVANVDAFELVSVLKNKDPAETLFVVVSKTFTTQETLLNAKTARQWLVEKLGEAAVGKHFVAVSTNGAEVSKFGIAAKNMFPMWDWVGGRFSLWSAVGLSLALSIGVDHFNRMLEGAATMDIHFRDAPLATNMPVLLAMFGVWQRNFMDAPAVAVLPYNEKLRDLPRFLQQLEMESNGKYVTRDGARVDYATAPVIFGECGTVGQHSFHQWLHQGSNKVAADFIGVVEDDLQRPDHYRALLTNMAAQAAALAFGRAEAATPQEVYPGGRSSNLLIIDRLDPFHFGMLIALYEHKTFVQGVIWNLNSFDQPGVELGKRMARDLETQNAAHGATGEFTARLYKKLTSF